MNIENVIDYLSFLETREMKGVKIFRGQTKAEWDLSPSISRIPNPDETDRMCLCGWDEVEDYLLEEFQNQSAPYLSFSPESKIEWLVHAQHHGLPTTLLDWTNNPLKGLYFAVENLDHDNCDGAVFLGEPRSYSTTTTEIKEIEKITCFYSKHINSRISAQEGLFCGFPLPNLFENFIALDENTTTKNSELLIAKKIIIPKKHKALIRKELNTLGITRKFLFPGLDGISETIKRSFIDI